MKKMGMNFMRDSLGWREFVVMGLMFGAAWKPLKRLGRPFGFLFHRAEASGVNENSHAAALVEDVSFERLVRHPSASSFFARSPGGLRRTSTTGYSLATLQVTGAAAPSLKWTGDWLLLFDSDF